MKKLFILIFLLASISLQAQNVPDLIRTTPVPATGANKNNRATVDANLKAGLSFLPPTSDTYTLNGAKDSAGYVQYNKILKRLGVYRGAGIWDNPLNVITTSYQNLNINEKVQVITDATANFGKSLYLPQGSIDPGVRPIYGPYLGLENGEYTYKFYLKINTNLTDTARFLHVDIAENGNSIMSTFIRYSDFIGANVWTPFRIVFNGVKGRNYECRIDVVHGSDPYPAQYPTKTNLWYDYGQIIGIREFVPTDLGVYATHAYVDTAISHIPITSYTFSNGLTKTGNNVKLGGPLIDDTSIGSNNKSFDIGGIYNNSDYYDLQLGNGAQLTYAYNYNKLLSQVGALAGAAVMSIGQYNFPYHGQEIRFDGNTMSIKDELSNKGLQYNQDYSANGKLDDRWIPDWGAVKSIIPASIDTTTLARKTGSADMIQKSYSLPYTASVTTPSIGYGKISLNANGSLVVNKANGYTRTWASTYPGATTFYPAYKSVTHAADSADVVNLTLPQNIPVAKTLGSKLNAATFTIYGTSLATKFGFNGTWRYSDGYPYKLTKSLNFQLSLKGGTGNTTLTYTNAIAASPIPAYTAGDMIGFEVGVNDATNADATTYSTANFTTRVNSLINSAIAAGYPANRIYIFSAFYWTLGDPTRANDIVNATASIASTRGVLYFDGYNTYKSRVLDNTFTLSGGLHPTIAAQTVVAADMQTYLNAYTINSSTELLNVFDAGSFNTLNSYGSASFSGNTTINNLKLNTSRVAAGDAIGDIYTRDADGFTTPIPAVAVGQVLISKGVGVPPDYSNAPVVTRLTSNQDIFISSARTGGGYSLQINQAFTPVANNQIVSGGLIAPTFVTGTGALTATATGTTSAADGTVTAQATVTTSGTGSGATYTVTTAGNVATVVTMVVAGTGYATGDTFTIAALPGITFTVASLGYTGITRSAMTFNNAPITLTTITTPANPVTGQIWNTTGVFKAFGAAGATRRIVLADDGAPSTIQMLVGTGTDWTRTTVTGTAGTSPVLSGSPTITGATLTGIRPASTFQASTGTTADSLRFASSQRMVEKALAIQSGTGQTAVQTATTLTLGNDTTVIRTVLNSYTKAQVDALLKSQVDNILTKTASYTIVGGDFAAGKKTTLDLYVDATAGAVTITLPSASTFAGYTIYITKTDATANAITVNTVTGANTLTGQDQSRQFNSNATVWRNH